MPTLLAQIAPQRSTQYSELAADLAPHELRLSPVGRKLGAVQVVTLGGQDFLECELLGELDEGDRLELGWLAMTSAHFLGFAEVGGVQGPFLRPIETGFVPALPAEMAVTRRYRGKTNELFTHFLCNVARFSSAFAGKPWAELRLFDPLAGGGTTLFTALMLGAEAAGVEQGDQDVKSTAAFVRQYAREQRIRVKEKEERLRKLRPGGSRRWTFELGPAPGRRCVLALGDTQNAAELIAGFKPHLIVTDLPYGIQHSGPLADLLRGSLPGWASVLPVGGCVVFSWDATRFTREEMVETVAAEASLAVLDDSPYDQLAHRVDRVIKRRDVLVALRR